MTRGGGTKQQRNETKQNPELDAKTGPPAPCGAQQHCGTTPGQGRLQGSDKGRRESDGKECPTMQPRVANGDRLGKLSQGREKQDLSYTTQQGTCSLPPRAQGKDKGDAPPSQGGREGRPFSGSRVGDTATTVQGGSAGQTRPQAPAKETNGLSAQGSGVQTRSQGKEKPKEDGGSSTSREHCGGPPLPTRNHSNPNLKVGPGSEGEGTGGEDPEEDEPFQTVAGRQGRPRPGSLERGEDGAKQQFEHRFGIADFVPDWVMIQERSMWSKYVVMIFKTRPVYRCRLYVTDGAVIVRGPLRRADAASQLRRLVQSDRANLPERQCYCLMNHQNLVEFTKRTGAYAIIRPKEGVVFVIGPGDSIARARHHLLVQGNGDGNRRVMRVSVLARAHLLSVKDSLVKDGHIWLVRESERDDAGGRTQELHIVGYAKDFDFEKAERAIRKAEQDFLRSPQNAPQLSPGRQVSVLTSGQAQLQVRKHRDSAKLLIAEPLPEQPQGPLPMATACTAPATTSASGAPTMSLAAAPNVPFPCAHTALAHRTARVRVPPIVTAGVTSRTGASSTDDFPHLVNPLKAGSASQWSRMRGDPTNHWAAGVPVELGSISSAVASTGTHQGSLYPYPSSASSTGRAQREEEDTERDLIPAESLIPSDVADDMDALSSMLDSPSGRSSANRLTPQQIISALHSAVKSAAGAPFTPHECEQLAEIASAAGIRVYPTTPGANPLNGPPALVSPCETPRSSPVRGAPANAPSSLKLLVHFRGGRAGMEGKHVFELPPGVPFGEHRTEVLRQLEVEDADRFVFERLDPDFRAVVLVRDHEVLPPLSRLSLRPTDMRPPAPGDFD
eukprot:Hpha_TRINITY_DN12716_c0_g1::TRINITY_DN12716_c0_g1_i1::g.114226::m.114226